MHLTAKKKLDDQIFWILYRKSGKIGNQHVKILNADSEKTAHILNLIYWHLVHWVYPYPYAPLSVRCTLIRTIFGRDENAYKPKRLCRRVPLSERFLAELRCTDKGTPSVQLFVRNFLNKLICHP
jgi:hypothetical protein